MIAQLWHRVRQSSLFVKWTNWEYYPMYITYIPTVLFWLYFSIRSRSLFFFSAVNPSIKTGGMMGQSKMNILNHIPTQYLPKTFLVKKEEINLSYILQQLEIQEIAFPIIAKPDIGERGFLVEKLEDVEELNYYLANISTDFLIQEFVKYATEVSVFYHRMPNTGKGKITSVCLKKTLSVIGDGVSTIEKLMQAYPRARFQLDRFRTTQPQLLAFIPNKNQEIELEPIGNHCRGTTFLNGNNYIDELLEKTFDGIVAKMKNIHYGRFDIKCQNLDLLKKGREFKILEFNGIASEPAHVYDPNYSITKAYRDIFQHWKIIYQISKIQRQNGIIPMSFKEGIRSIQEYLNYMRTAQS